jgi:hypothetical protein
MEAAMNIALFQAGRTRGAFRRVVPGLALCAALSVPGPASAENWINIPGADDCRVDTDSAAYDAQADVVAFRYACPGLEIASVAAGCTSNDWWRAKGATPTAQSRGNWLSELFRGRAPVAPVTGMYTDRADIDRGTPIGRGRQLVCASKDRYRAFKFAEER